MTKQFRYSTISDFQKCQAYYDIKHNQGIPDGSDKSGDMSFGTSIHGALEQAHQVDGCDAVEFFKTHWGSRPKDLEYGRLKGDALMDIGVALVQIYIEEHKKHFIPTHLEQKMLLDYNGYTVGGTADGVGLYRGVPSIIDYKTSSMPYDNYKIYSNPQMYLYAYLARETLKVDIKQLVYIVLIKDIKNPRIQVKKVDVSPDILETKFKEFAAICNEVSTKGTFHKNPLSCMNYNRVCPYFERCFK
jgi:PD-(D/E)XK nuclease superfamily